MSFSPIHRKVEGIKETYVHGVSDCPVINARQGYTFLSLLQGMYRAALGIYNTLAKHFILKKAFEKYKVQISYCMLKRPPYHVCPAG